MPKAHIWSTTPAKCTLCNRTKPAHDFDNSNTPSRPYSACKTCRARRKASKEGVVLYQIQRAAVKKAKLKVEHKHHLYYHMRRLARPTITYINTLRSQLKASTLEGKPSERRHLTIEKHESILATYHKAWEVQCEQYDMTDMHDSIDTILDMLKADGYPTH